MRLLEWSKVRVPRLRCRRNWDWHRTSWSRTYGTPGFCPWSERDHVAVSVPTTGRRQELRGYETKARDPAAERTFAIGNANARLLRTFLPAFTHSLIFFLDILSGRLVVTSVDMIID